MDIDCAVDDNMNLSNLSYAIEQAMVPLERMNGKEAKYLLSYLESIRDECDRYEE